MFGSFDISVSGMQAQRVRLNTVASNLAHMEMTRNERGESVPYRRKVPVFEPLVSKNGQPGVRVSAITEDQSPFRAVPTAPGAHPDRQTDGNVYYPNVDPITEMTDGMEAQRAFEANVAAFEMTKSMLNSSLRLLA